MFHYTNSTMNYSTFLNSTNHTLNFSNKNTAAGDILIVADFRGSAKLIFIENIGFTSGKIKI